MSTPRRARAIAFVLLLCAAPPLAADVAVDLRAAAAALQAGEYQRAAYLAGPVARGAPGAAAVDRRDRAEAWRLYGLALFFLGRRGPAEAALFEYLKLDVDAHLDPVLVPPEAISFFEDVRLRHAVELRAYRPRPHRRRWPIFLPPAGQFQNGDKVRGWILLGTEAALLGTNVVSTIYLYKWCSERGQSCVEGRTDDARTMRTINHASFYALGAVLLYGIADAYIVDRRQRRAEEELQLGLLPTDHGATVVVGGRF